MPIEAALIKPVVDALMAALKKARSLRLRSDARNELSAAIRELLLADPDRSRAKAAIAAAKAAGIINEDLFLAKRLLKSSKKPRPGKRAKKKREAKDTPAADKNLRPR